MKRLKVQFTIKVTILFLTLVCVVLAFDIFRLRPPSRLDLFRAIPKKIAELPPGTTESEFWSWLGISPVGGFVSGPEHRECGQRFLSRDPKLCLIVCVNKRTGQLVTVELLGNDWKKIGAHIPPEVTHRPFHGESIYSPDSPDK